MKYAMSDIHGEYRNFMNILKQINMTAEDVLYVLGDAIDRGPDNLKVLQYIKTHPNIVFLKGNHDHFCELWLERELGLAGSYGDKLTVTDSLWCSWGGENTLKEVKALSVEEKTELHRYLASLPTMIEADTEGFGHVLLTHSGVMADLCPDEGVIDLAAVIERGVRESQIHQLVSKDLFYMAASAIKRFDKFMIVGHTPTIFIEPYHENKICYTSKFIDIDCGGGYREKGGRLACLNLDTREEFYK